jgi:hypothetical protein
VTALLPIRLKHAILDLAVYHCWNGLTNFLDQAFVNSLTQLSS